MFSCLFNLSLAIVELDVVLISQFNKRVLRRTSHEIPETNRHFLVSLLELNLAA